MAHSLTSISQKQTSQTWDPGKFNVSIDAGSDSQPASVPGVEPDVVNIQDLAQT